MAVIASVSTTQNNAGQVTSRPLSGMAPLPPVLILHVQAAPQAFAVLQPLPVSYPI